jgi:hypothetical protein
MKLADIPVHDPWSLAERESETHYLYTSALPSDTGEKRYGVKACESADMATWEGPRIAFLIPDGTWTNPALVARREWLRAKGLWLEDVRTLRRRRRASAPPTEQMRMALGI